MNIFHFKVKRRYHFQTGWWKSKSKNRLQNFAKMHIKACYLNHVTLVTKSVTVIYVTFKNDDNIDHFHRKISRGFSKIQFLKTRFFRWKLKIHACSWISVWKHAKDEIVRGGIRRDIHFCAGGSGKDTCQVNCQDITMTSSLSRDPDHVVVHRINYIQTRNNSND